MRLFAATAILLGTCVAGDFSRKFYDDDPFIQEPPQRDVNIAKVRNLSDYYDLFSHTVATPGERQRSGAPIPARGINTVGDPMEGPWWERRHYWRRMSLVELERGPAKNFAPDMDGDWTVVSAKTEGITPGFVVIDRHKRRYFIKFDPPSNPEMATGAEQISSRIFYALGYHVPEDYIVYFRREILTLGKVVAVQDRFGNTRSMTRKDLDDILARVHQGSDGLYRATATLAVPGTPIGPYRYYGTRSDDPNDTVPHEHRRDLRGMHLACALVNHDDSRALNTYDSLTDGPSGKFIKHYQLDFGSTLGSGSTRPNSPRSGGEYLFGFKQAALQFVTLGMVVPHWAHAKYPELRAVGRFESESFDPDRWVPEYPNPAFLNRLPDDEFWMAKQIVNLRDDEIHALVKSARYSDPKTAEWVAKCLIERRNRIGSTVFRKVLPIDRFELGDGQLKWVDLGAEYGLGTPLDIQVRWAVFDNQRETSTPIPGLPSARLPVMQGDGYWMAELEAASRPGQKVHVYARKRGGQIQVVGIEHTW